MSARTAVLLAALASLAGPAAADPCGMVPPAVQVEGPVITRVGAQKTYVFYRNGIEAFVIRPGFAGKVEEFGMLIPFPSPPALYKVDEAIFSHIAAAVDPPEVVVRAPQEDAARRRRLFSEMTDHLSRLQAITRPGWQRPGDPSLAVHEVRLVREEAVGMYQVAVLAAGSASALKRWMGDHGYRYPAGMDRAAQDYVEAGWGFVTVRTQVGKRSQVEPRPGMRRAAPGLPPGATFDGHVQAMGFRFRSPTLVVPMRLSAYNEGELRNVVYLLAEGPRCVEGLSEKMVVRQVSGEELVWNLTQPLPLRIVGGVAGDLTRPLWEQAARARDPEPHNGRARDLFAADLLAAREGKLVLRFEEQEKALSSIAEQLGLRGPEMDGLHREATRERLAELRRRTRDDLRAMTLTVVDGDFPRPFLASRNLTFEPYRMPEPNNRRAHYHAPSLGPLHRRGG